MPGAAALGRDLFGVELVGDLADGQAAPVQPADTAGDLLLGLVRDELLAVGGEPIADPAAGEPAPLGFEPAAAAQPGDDQAPVQLVHDPGHLPHRGPHRVVGVIPQDHALVGGEHPSADLLPHLGQDGLLDGDLPGQLVEAVADQPSALPVAIMSMAAVNAARSSRSRAPLRPSSGNMPTMRWPLRRAHARISRSW
jgi:hypothetical protein